jgi:hypothetical protein
MNTGSIIIKMKKRPDGLAGSAYCANHISVMFRDRIPVLSFMCSGVLTIVPCAEVQAIEWYENGRNLCSECDSPLLGSFG